MRSLYGAIVNYKFNYMEKKKSKGLGDTIQKITKATGLQAATKLGNKLLGKKDCGCNKRQEILNNKFPYKQ